LIFVFGTYEVLYLMYAATEPLDLGIRDNATNVEYASYVYLFSSIIMSLLVLFLKEISLNLKRVLTSVVTLFYLFSWILTLITFYSNPNNRVEVFAGAIFFMAGSIFLASSFFVKVKKYSDEQKELGAFHKVVRYLLVFIIFASMLYPILQPMIEKSKIHKTLNEIVKYNRPLLPRMLDEVTRQDTIEATDLKLKYEYTIIDERIDKNYFDKNFDAIKNSVKLSSCREKIIKELVQNHVVLEYVYKLKNSSHTFTYELNSCN